MTAPDTVYVNKKAASRSGEQIDFSFGKNRLAYAAGLEERHIPEAQRSFTESTVLDSLVGYTFLDAGCGSGLSSLVALRLNADKVVSLDIDPSSVACTKQLRSRFALQTGKWDVRTLSLLNRDLSSKVPPSSLACCWGGGASTGSMWEAIIMLFDAWPKAACFFWRPTIASGIPTHWLRIKRVYNWAPAPIKKLLRLAFHIRTFGSLILHGQNPLRFVREYVQHLGMTYFRDVEDGLGCLPYEYASVEKITAFLAPKWFELVHVKHAASHGCNEFVFRKLTPQKQG